MSALRSQRLAHDAHERVKARAEANMHAGTKEAVVPVKYATRVRNLPIWIRENGLIQSLAFLQVKACGENGETDRELLDDLASILKCGTVENLIGRAETDPAAAYRLLTRDALAVSMWMKRWCETYTPPKPSQTADTKERDENEAR